MCNCKYSTHMPNVTLYVKDPDLEIINRAKSELGDSLSAVFMDCVRQRLERRAEPAPDKMEKIVLVMWNQNEQPVIRKSFVGRWLAGGPSEGRRADDDSHEWPRNIQWSIAQTQRGAIVAYTQDPKGYSAPTMEVFENFDDFKDAENSAGLCFPQNIIAEVAHELGEPYEIELDI